MKDYKRRCIATRKLFEVTELIRVVKTKENEFFINSSKEGRGAYIWIGLKDITILRRNRLLNRSFKVEVPLKIYDLLERTLREKHER